MCHAPRVLPCTFETAVPPGVCASSTTSTYRIDVSVML
jgi:hypothetical protein